MKTEKKFIETAAYVSPQLYTVPVILDAGFAQSAGADDMGEVDDEW